MEIWSKVSPPIDADLRSCIAILFWHTPPHNTMVSLEPSETFVAEASKRRLQRAYPATSSHSLASSCTSNLFVSAQHFGLGYALFPLYITSAAENMGENSDRRNRRGARGVSWTAHSHEYFFAFAP